MIPVPVTEVEKDLIEKQAKKYGMNTSQYLRFLAHKDGIELNNKKGERNDI